MERIEQFLQDLDANTAADVVYDEPIQTDGNLIIPASEVVSGMGFGVGVGEGSDARGGKAGHIFSRPVAMIVTSPQGVRVDPVLDYTKLALAAATAGLFILGFFLRMLNPRETLKKLSRGEWD